MKRPFDIIIDSVSENLDKTLEFGNKNLDFLQTYLVWMMGFSTGSLYLLVSNFVNDKVLIPHSVIKAIAISLVCSIIFGIISRFTLFLFQAELNNNSFYLKAAFKRDTGGTLTFGEVDDLTDVMKLVDLLKYDFDEDESETVKLYNNDDSGKLILLELLKKKYKNLAEWGKKDIEIAMNHVDNVIKEGYGYTDSELTKIKNPKVSIRFYRQISFGSLYFSALAFIIALIILVAAY